MAQTAKPKFILEGNTLTVCDQLGLEDEAKYSEALFELLEAGHTDLVIDFSRLTYVSSSYVGATGLLLMMAVKKQVPVKVIANPTVANIFEIVGFHKLMKLEVKEDE